MGNFCSTDSSEQQLCCDITKMCGSKKRDLDDPEANFKLIEEQEFVDRCQTGDLILFRNSMIQGKILRTITWSQFDHVAMLIKIAQFPGKIFIFEAVSDGVRLVTWESLRQYIGVNRFYVHAAVRFVKFDRDDEMYKNLMKFIDESLGLQYGLTTQKLLKTKSVAVPSVIQSQVQVGSAQFKKQFVQEDRTFFCSELVAKLCKVLGIIENNDLSCTKFYPSHFTSQGDSFLTLTPNTDISEEYVIDLHQQKKTSIQKNATQITGHEENNEQKYDYDSNFDNENQEIQ